MSFKAIIAVFSIFAMGLIIFFKLNEVPLLSINQEVETKFLIVDNDVFYTSNKTGKYQLFKYSGSGSNIVVSGTESVINPFLYSSMVTGLTDNNGDENFVATNENLNRKLNGKNVKSIFSFGKGALIVYHPSGSDKVYALDTTNDRTSLLLDHVQKLHDVSYSVELHSFIANHDTKLSYIDIRNEYRIVPIDSSSTGEKMNPFIYKDDVYYSNNSTAEFFQIFKVSLAAKSYSKKLVLASQHDVRLPKFDGRRLFYVEVVRNEYLLKMVDLKTGLKRPITERGVVFNYHFGRDSTLFISFSDSSTPKCILKYNLKFGSTINITRNIPEAKFTFQFINDSNRSTGYIINPNGVNGIIMFFHPGSDFSPRWDPMLMNLCNNGYVIIAPNYPGSSGFGKTYANLNEQETIKDIQKWKAFILKNYSDKKLYYLAYSSGNPLMEKTLLNDSNGINGAISLFGIPNNILRVQVPSLYILGRNDFRINFKHRINHLKGSDPYRNLSILDYENEGHMFRQTVNQDHAVKQMVYFLRRN